MHKIKILCALTMILLLSSQSSLAANKHTIYFVVCKNGIYPNIEVVFSQLVYKKMNDRYYKELEELARWSEKEVKRKHNITSRCISLSLGTTADIARSKDLYQRNISADKVKKFITVPEDLVNNIK